MEIQILSLTKVEQFCLLFQHLKAFTEFVNIQFLPDKLFIQGLDSAHVSMFMVSIPSTWFDTYTLTRGEQQPVTLGVNVHILCKILTSRERTQKMRIVHTSSEENAGAGADSDEKMFIYFTAGNAASAATAAVPMQVDGAATAAVVATNKITSSSSISFDFDRHFEMPLVDITSESLDIPEIDYAAELSLQSSKFFSVVSQLKQFGDTMEMFCTEERIEITSTSPGAGKMCVDIKIEELTSYAINENEQLRLSYSLGQLYNICMFYKISPHREVHLALSDNFPMRFTYNLDDTAFITFYLAPKIADTD